MVNLYTVNYQTPQPVVVNQKKTSAPVAEPTNPMTRNFLEGRGIKSFYMPIQKTPAITETPAVKGPWKNDLKDKFHNNDVKICAIIMRSFNAKDTDKDGLILEHEKTGTYLSAIERLPELKKMGINAIHVLPIQPPGEQESMGNAGSVYAVKDLLKLDPKLRDPKDPRDEKEQFKAFVDACHENNIRVLLDLPSCAALDFYNQPENKKFMAISENGLAKVPQGWDDIRMFETFKNKDKRELNHDLVEMHKDFVDMCIDLGVDGIRADVARAKPPEFWDIIIPYSRAKDPQFGWLAETYTYEDASPMLNMDYDRPEEILNSGFDVYYGQFHIFDQWLKGDDLHNYMRENIEMTHKLEKTKGLIGSFATHDDVSPMYQGKTLFCNLATGLMNTLPMTNPYFVDGFQSGDYYSYEYGNKLRVPETQLQEHDDVPVYEIHNGMIDIFNTSRRPGGKNPEIGEFFSQTTKMREEHKNVITKGSYIPLKVKGAKEAENIIAYARHKDGKTILVIANRNLNGRRAGNVEIPGLNASQKMKNLVPSYGEASKFQPKENSLSVDLGPGRFHVFEINTPDIEKEADEVLKPYSEENKAKA